MQGNRYRSQCKTLAIFMPDEASLVSQAMFQDRLGIPDCVIDAAARPGMIAVRMREYGTVDRFPRVYKEIPGRTLESSRGKLH
jgi:hypothetical protein